METQVINDFNGKNRIFSNFWPDSGTDTVEHFYQAEKALDPTEKRWVLAAPTPGIAKKRGRAVTVRPDWDQVKVGYMTIFVSKKFENPTLREVLLATGNAILIEGNHWHDNFWGDCWCSKCKNIQGQNHLGKILMQIREDIKSSNTNRN